MRILVTGAAGYMGSAPALVNRCSKYFLLEINQ
jgi:nucleoside-diphosphate-sugar epimerase